MTGAYPIEVDPEGLSVLVVGAGRVATRKVAGVVEIGGRPVVVAPEVTREIERLAEEHRLIMHRRDYRDSDARGFSLVFAATQHPELNLRVAEDARRHGALVNVVNVPGASTFRLPAVLRRGTVTIACGTGGGSPRLASLLRDRLATVVGEGIGPVADRLGRLREEVRERWPEDEERRRAFWFELLSEDFLDAALEGRDEEVESMIHGCLSRSSD